MMLYASPPGGSKNRSVLAACGFGLIVSPHTERMAASWDGPIVLDNGAWSTFQSGIPFDFDAFERFCFRMLSKTPAWVIAPDVVGDLDETRRLAERWVPRLQRLGMRVLFAAQDGCIADHVEESGADGVALGGTTAWKIGQILRPEWRRLPIRHVLRVNTRQRLRASICGGWTSCDGSGATRFSMHALRMREWSAETFQARLFA